MRSSALSPIFFFSSLTNALPLTDNVERIANSQLRWGPCDLEGIEPETIFLPIQCATLSVPLDYASPDSRNLDLQLLKVNATSGSSKSSVLFNPGGPGASTVEDLATKSYIYDGVLGGNHDMIAFDPRGVGRTIPFICDVDWAETRTNNTKKPRSIVWQEDLFDRFDPQGWEAAGLIADACYEQNKETGDFLSSAFVVEDMVRIIDALDEDGMLRFWGMSYGTALGQYFAAIYPERVDRMILDSVVNAADYQAGLWNPVLTDTEGTLMAFFESCIDAGPLLCPLANLTGADTTTPETLLSTFNEGLQALQESGQIAPASLIPFVWDMWPDTRTYYAVKALTFAQLYHPTQYPLLALTLQPLMTQNFSAFLEEPESTGTSNVTAPVPWNIGAPNNFFGIACTDGAWRAESPDSIHDIINEQQANSGFSDAFTKIWPCTRWKFSAENRRYTGSFGTPDNQIQTHHPIMIINGRYDPATPLVSAYNASQEFAGSSVLVHGGNGHKLIRHPSKCTVEAIQAYMDEGVLPVNGTLCEPDVKAFEVAVAGGEAAVSNITLLEQTYEQLGIRYGQEANTTLQMKRWCSF
jgi:pimeloyl-ACP methyl ester carboxylesterase